MKVQLVQRGDKYFIRRYRFGFIPQYWDDWDFMWTSVMREYSKSEADATFSSCIKCTTRQKEYSKAPDTVIKSIEI
jgi:hypothetical protein